MGNVSIFLGCGGRRKRRKAKVFFIVGPVEEAGPVEPTLNHESSIKGKVIFMITIKSSQKVTIRVAAFKDSKGNPAKVDGPPQWFTDNTDVLALHPAEDGMSCKVSAVGPLTDEATVTMRADSAEGPELDYIMGSMKIGVVAGRARTVELAADEPVEQSEGPPEDPATPPSPESAPSSKVRAKTK